MIGPVATGIHPVQIGAKEGPFTVPSLGELS